MPQNTPENTAAHNQPGDRPESPIEKALRMSMGGFWRSSPRAQQPQPVQPGQPGAPATPAANAAPAAQPPDPIERAYVLLSVSKDAADMTAAAALTARFDAIYVGTVGSVGPDKRFYVHPDYAQIAYLYALAPAMPTALANTDAVNTTVQALPGMDEAGLAPGEQLLAVDLPASAQLAFRANMIEVASRRWSSLYAHMTRGLSPSMLNQMGLGAESLRNDERTTANNVAAFMQRNAMQLWDVAVVYETRIDEEDPAQRGATEADLLKCSSVVRNLQVAPQEHSPARPVQAPAQAGAEQPAAAAEPAPQPADWLVHTGPIEVTVDGTIRVRAGNAAQAGLVAGAMIEAAKASPQLLGQFLSPTPTAIARARMLPPTQQDEDEGDYWGERGMRDA